MNIIEKAITKAQTRNQVLNFLHNQFKKLPQFGWIVVNKATSKLELPDNKAKLEIRPGCFEMSVEFIYASEKTRFVSITSGSKQYKDELLKIEMLMMGELSEYLGAIDFGKKVNQNG